VAGPKRERTLYEIATSFFAVCVIVFAVAGLVAVCVGGGVGSPEFFICVFFLAIGLGRLYLSAR